VVPLDVGVRRALAHTLEEGPLIRLYGLVLDVAHDLGLRRYHWQRWFIMRKMVGLRLRLRFTFSEVNDQD
jgi:hypothetical protein